jgi:hypothetical protein
VGKRIIFIHGRSQKPERKILQKLWFDATRFGIERDFGDVGTKNFDKVKKEFVYYGDLSNDFLEQPDEDPTSRFSALEVLKSYAKKDYNKKTYLKVSDGGGLSDEAARMFSGILGTLGVADYLITKVAPDMAEYWSPEAYFGSDVRSRMTRVLKNALRSGDEIMIIAHSLGTMVTYDNLWKFSHYGEYRHEFGDSKKVHTLVTLGSPLGDENVKAHLKGSKSQGLKRYPTNLQNWINFAAVDDYISHDASLKNDYREMIKFKLLDNPIVDKKIYNLNVREGSANPHSSIGYLIHPELSELVYEWLKE